MAGPISAASDGFLERLKAGKLPNAVSQTRLDDAELTPLDLRQLFESQASSRLLDLASRNLAKDGKTFYSIGSSGHEGNAAIARVFRRDDIAFLHYRSGAFLIERARKVAGSTPIWDMALSFCASSDDPISGGRHKVLGSKELFIPPQTSTIASHLPKAVGAAFSIAQARREKMTDSPLPHGSVALCSFGDASSNHSTAQGAFNAAAWTAYRGLPLPLVFVCEDNGLGISVPTPERWVASNFKNRPGLEYIAGDARDLVDAARAARKAEAMARGRQKPVFLHMRTVRLMGHAGSDLEAAYRSKSEVEAEADQDPLLHTARHLVESCGVSQNDILTRYGELASQVNAVMEQAATRPRLTSAKQVMAPIVPPVSATNHAPVVPLSGERTKDAESPQHMSRLISLTLEEQMRSIPEIAVFGEDVGRKGGVYGATIKLQQIFGRGRVFDTLLDEQTILGMAIGMAHNGFIPIPEIQFLAYVHNAEDQLRGEAATLPFFSDGQYDNPMVVRIAGLGYQKGFGGHFHNDNAVGVFRDIPGIVLACPSHAEDAALMLREAIRLAREERRVVVFLEPIALYGTKDLHADGDGLMASALPSPETIAPFGEVGVFGEDGTVDCAILTYGNGTYMSRRVAKTLAKEGLTTRIIDLRWLNPLPMEAVMHAVKSAKSALIVDECRRTGSLAEELYTRLREEGFDAPLARINSDDSFIPLGPAANEVLISEEQIAAAVKDIAP